MSPCAIQYDRRVNTDSSDGPRREVRVGSIVIRCRRFDEMIAFWQAALGYVQQAPPGDGWVILTDPTGRGPNVSLDRARSSGCSGLARPATSAKQARMTTSSFSSTPTAIVSASLIRHKPRLASFESS